MGIDTWGGFFFVNLTPSESLARGHTLATQLGDAATRLANYPLADLRRVKRITYEIDANWKVMLENYNECYHCAGVHPELCKVVPGFKVRGGSELDWERGIEHAEGAWTFTHSGTSAREPFPGLSDDERVRHKGELIYPNFMISLAPITSRRSRLAAQRGAHDDRLRFSLSSERDREAGIRSARCGGILGSREPAGLGDLRGRAARDAQPSVRVGLLRANGELQPRHSPIRRRAVERDEDRVKRDYEYIVLGLGGLGSGAAYWLSRKAGAEVLGIEQFELGHVRGESQDHSRIIRLSYHNTAYVELAKLAYDAWETLERESGDQVVLKTGGLDIAKLDTKIPLDTYRSAMDACNVEYEDLDADEIMKQWPQFTLSDDIEGLFQEDSGIAMAARANEAHRKMARANGATLIDKTPVTNIVTRGNEVTVETSNGNVHLQQARDRRGAVVESRARLSGHGAPARGHARAGDVLRGEAAGRLRARSLPRVDLDG